MKIVTYSLSSNGPAQTTHYHEQLFHSVKSLRTYNTAVPVHVFLYGEHPRVFVNGLEGKGVIVHNMGLYEDAVKRIRPRAFRTLMRYPVLHKWMNFHKLAPLGPSQVLQIDCDTFFFADVEILFEHYADCHFYGREEPSSRASHYGYNPHYLDEDKLIELARREGAIAISPCNIGVSMLNHGVWNGISTRLEILLAYVFRFVASMARNQQTPGRLWPELAEVVMLDLLEQPEIEDLPFPSSNVWILDQVALWLTLGHVPDLTHGHFSRAHVLQGGEDGATCDTKVVHHYFGVDKNAFLSNALAQGSGKLVVRQT